jgi:hypothetical protein
MSNVITATLVVNFAREAGSQSMLVAELDSYPKAEGGLNNGKTSFAPGDAPAYLVYHTEDVQIVEHAASLGLISSLGSRTVEVVEFLQFPKTKEVSLSKPALSMPDLTWIGNSLSGGKLGPLGTSLLFASEGVAVCRAVYEARAYQFKLNNVPSEVGGLTEFEALIYIAGEAS